MTSMSTQRETPLDPTRSEWIYDVFLSFRGEDTRKTFTGHLYSALDNRGIFTFKDNHRLERGKVISSELFKAIEESKFAVIVLSENYASSTWCLDELAKIMECKKAMGQIVFPIFYRVNPSEVRKQMGSFKKAFAEHEKNFKDDLEKVQKWRFTLREIANLSGWHLQDGEESTLIKSIVDEISSKLGLTLSYTTENLVGMDSRLKQVDSLIGIGVNDVRMLGFYGMGGIGKTTLAKFVLGKISHHFDFSSFLANVREVSMAKGLVTLQRQVISEILIETNINTWNDNRVGNEIQRRLRHKRVLLILDDVDKVEQLQALAGKHDWFGLGSRIIVTTRDRHLLSTHGVNFEHKVDGLNRGEAFQLFCWKAFRKGHPSNDYLDLSFQLVRYADGLPLALEVLGSFLFGRSKIEWKSALNRLKKVPDKRIFEILKISFDGLKDLEKKIFLDIACFFKGRNKDEVREILDSCDFYPDIGISILIDKCIISLSNNTLCMHDLIQGMGREVVRQECLEKPGKRSRLWLSSDIYSVLKKNEGTKAVEGIVLDFPEYKELQLKAKSFSRMKNLRYLKIKDVILSQGLDYLSDELRILNWYGYPLRFLPSNFQQDKLFELKMCYSHVTQLWKGVKHMNQLKIIVLSHSIYLTETPDFTGVPNLERLVLDGCTNLSYVHPSIGLLKRLILLNLTDCKKLKSLRTEVEWESLEVLFLSGCSGLSEFQGIVASAKQMLKLVLDGTSIKELPSIQHLNRLEVLNLNGCWKLEKLPEDLGHAVRLENIDLSGTAIKELPSIQLLSRLVVLNLNGCSKLKKLPEDMGRAVSLKNLHLCGTAIKELPSIQHLTKLHVLKLNGSSKLEKLPEDMGHATNLKILDLSGTAISQLPSSITLLMNLQELTLHGCKGQQHKSCDPLPLVPRANPRDSMGLQLPSFSSLRSLTTLNLGDCNLQEGAIPSDLGCLPSLCKLDLSSNNFVSLPASLSGLPMLRHLVINGCNRLRVLPALPSSTTMLFANNCSSLEIVSASASHKVKSTSRIFSLSNCFKLRGDQERNSVIVTFVKNLLMQSLWRSQCQKTTKESIFTEFDIVVPGSRVPDWFHHQSMGPSTRIWPPIHVGSNTFRGLAVCAVVSLDYHQDVLVQAGDLSNNASELECSLKVGTYESSVAMSFYENSLLAESDHLWMCYLPRGYLAKEFLPEYHRSINAYFRAIDHPDMTLKVKACGLRAVFDRDMEEFLRASNNIPSRRSKLVELYHDSSLVTSNTIKRSRDEHCPDQQPYPKRLR